MRIFAIVLNSSPITRACWNDKTPSVTTISHCAVCFLCNAFVMLNPRRVSVPDRNRSCCISVDLYRRPEHIYGIFIALFGLHQKLLPKNCWWPKVAWNDLSDLTRGHWLVVAIFRLSGSSLPVTRCLRESFEWFSPKEASFIFLPLT